jgi:hypothetical protein
LFRAALRPLVFVIIVTSLPHRSISPVGNYKFETSRGDRDAMNEDPVALITGATHDIGLAVAHRFLAAGWHVAMLDVLGDTIGDSARLSRRDPAESLWH